MYLTLTTDKFGVSLVDLLVLSMAVDQSGWDIGNNGIKTINKNPLCNRNCHIKEACIIAFRELQSMWKQWISHPNSPICSLPQTAYVSYSYYWLHSSCKGLESRSLQLNITVQPPYLVLQFLCLTSPKLAISLLESSFLYVRLYGEKFPWISSVHH